MSWERVSVTIPGPRHGVCDPPTRYITHPPFSSYDLALLSSHERRPLRAPVLYSRRNNDYSTGTQAPFLILQTHGGVYVTANRARLSGRVASFGCAIQYSTKYHGGRKNMGLRCSMDPHGVICCPQPFETESLSSSMMRSDDTTIRDPGTKDAYRNLQDGSLPLANA